MQVGYFQIPRNLAELKLCVIGVNLNTKIPKINLLRLTGEIYFLITYRFAVYLNDMNSWGVEGWIEFLLALITVPLAIVLLLVRLAVGE